MARKPKGPREPEAPAATAERVRQIIERGDKDVPAEIIRDAFLEGRDHDAVTLLRQRDGHAHRKAAATHAQKADECTRNIPPNCAGAIPALERCGEQAAAARAHLDMLPHDYRAANDSIFGLVNKTSHRIGHLTRGIADVCKGSMTGSNPDPRDFPSGLRGPRRKR